MIDSKLSAALDSVTEPGFTASLEGMFAKMAVAEEEIAKACAAHPEQADLIWHGAFRLTWTTHKLMDTEWLYRAHVRELCDRLAAGQDTRPGTDAELAICCSVTSGLAPFHSSAAGLYARVFTRICPPELGNPWDETEEHYEALHSSQMDDLEREMRRKLSQADRKTELPGKDYVCDGQHAGAPVLSCRWEKEGATA